MDEEAEQPESFEVTDVGVNLPDGGSTYGGGSSLDCFSFKGCGVKSVCVFIKGGGMGCSLGGPSADARGVCWCRGAISKVGRGEGVARFEGEGEYRRGVDEGGEGSMGVLCSNLLVCGAQKSKADGCSGFIFRFGFGCGEGDGHGDGLNWTGRLLLGLRSM